MGKRPSRTGKKEKKNEALRKTSKWPSMTKEQRKEKYTKKAREERNKRVQKEKASRLICFNCRKRGHGVANCPETSEKAAAASICYKCGSGEHALSKCPKRGGKNDDGSLPFATCFICKETGHLASRCPNNSKGIYVNGGACKICGSKQHRAADCPEKSNKKGTDTKGSVEEQNYDDLLEGESGQPAVREKDGEIDHKERVSKKRRVVTF